MQIFFKMILWLYKLFTSLNMHIHLHYFLQNLWNYFKKSDRLSDNPAPFIYFSDSRILWLKTIQLLIIHQMHPNPEQHNFLLVHLNLYTKINYCCYTYTDVSSAKIFCMDFTAENKNIYNLHGWQLGVTNKTRSQFAAYNRDKIIDWWKIGLIILSASPG